MTTALYDRRTKTIGADTQNTDSAGTAWRCKKIETLSDGRYFLGSGHLFTITQMRNWANVNFSVGEDNEPDFDLLRDDDTREEYSASCLIISKDGERVWLLDDEMIPFEVFDECVAVGSGAAYAIGAMDAGATVEQALYIACQRDMNTSEPIDILVINQGEVNNGN